MHIPYRSRSKLHKFPSGAIKAGEELTLRVVLPRVLQCRGVAMQWGDYDGAWEQTQAFFWEGMQGEHEEWWQCRVTIPEPGLYRYRFVYESDHGSGVIGNEGGGVGMIGQGVRWQLTVYDPAFVLPTWVPGGVLYQIFPDRFFDSGQEKSEVPTGRVLRSDWHGAPQWQPDEAGRITQYDFFGGDLAGIAQKLDYLQSLGVTCIYLNPIFAAESNHRYDTADYMQIDPLLGDEEDFRQLCAQAKQRGIHVILDGVFSHTGKRSVYFESAQASQDSPYYNWYSFDHWPNGYASWWGIDILPELQEKHPAVLDFFTGEQGVVRHWLRAGAAGWRLDVADELPDVFLDRLFAAAKAEDPESYVLGEVWEDASNKHSHGGRRRFLLGRQMHSVMNYPLANAILQFARHCKAEQLAEVVESQRENYPPVAIQGLMNHIGTHDTPRALNRLVSDGEIGREDVQIPQEALAVARRRLELCAALQYTLPGNPCVYYGDEAGLTGAMDPFNRACYPWGHEDEELLSHYRTLGQLRQNYSALASGEIQMISAALGCIAYQRPGRPALVVIANANPHAIRYTLPQEYQGVKPLFGGQINGCEVAIEAESACVLRLQDH